MQLASQITVFLLRVVAGLLFMQSGGMKLFHWFGGPPSAIPMTTQLWIAAYLEFFGGIAIMLGLCTRIVGFILSGEMAVAYFQFHQPRAFWPAQNHGETAVLLCFIFLYFAANGGGRWSLDALMRGRSGNVAYDEPVLDSRSARAA